MTLPSRVPELPPSPDAGAELTDHEILDLVAAGRLHAFDVLVSRYGARIRRYLGQLLGPDAAIDDLAQETFVKVFRRVRSYDRARSFPVWLFRVAHNEGLDHLRREQARRRALRGLQEADGPVLRTVGTPLRELEANEFREHLDRALRELPETFRAPFLLRENEGLSYEEIGEIVGASAKTVSTRIHRARLRLRGLLASFLGARPDAERGRTSP